MGARLGRRRVRAVGEASPGGRRRDGPLSSAGAEIGVVTVAVPTRTPLARDDARLLEALARHGGLAVGAIALAEEVGISRQRLVSAREEERRRVGRDLHDGLGPTLAAIACSSAPFASCVTRIADGGARCVGSRRRRASRSTTCAGWRASCGRRRWTSSASSRHCAATRPTSASSSSPTGTSTVEVPAAVEVAAYRIGHQALANVAAHAGVRCASLRVAVSPDGLCLEVADRGVASTTRSTVSAVVHARTRRGARRQLPGDVDRRRDSASRPGSRSRA